MNTKKIKKFINDVEEIKQKMLKNGHSVEGVVSVAMIKKLAKLIIENEEDE